MNQPCTQHQHNLLDQELVVLAGLIRLQHHVIEARSSIAVLIRHQLHQQHAFEEVERLGNPHTRTGQAKQRRDLSILPGIFGFFTTELRAFGHRPGLTAVANLATLLIFGGLAETSFVGLLVNLGASQLIAAADYVHSCFLATHEWAQHLVDQTVFDQGF